MELVSSSRTSSIKIVQVCGIGITMKIDWTVGCVVDVVVDCALEVAEYVFDGLHVVILRSQHEVSHDTHSVR